MSAAGLWPLPGSDATQLQSKSATARRAPGTEPTRHHQCHQAERGTSSPAVHSSRDSQGCPHRNINVKRRLFDVLFSGDKELLFFMKVGPLPTILETRRNWVGA